MPAPSIRRTERAGILIRAPVRTAARVYLGGEWGLRNISGTRGR
jgi:hypothetical protein